METFCLPLLSYSCEALSYSKQQLNLLNICWNRHGRRNRGVWGGVPHFWDQGVQGGTGGPMKFSYSILLVYAWFTA